MALRYVGLQIAQAREETGETDYSATNGVPQSVPIQALTEGVIHCQNSLYSADPKIFDIITYFDAVIGQVEYDLPENAYMGASIGSVEFSSSGADTDYYRLALSDYGYRDGGSGDPARFVPYGEGKIIIDPPCSQTGGKFRVVHGAHLDTPDLRRGKILSVTKDVPMTSYTTVVLDPLDSTLDETTIGQNEYFCSNDKNGNVEYYNVPYTSYDTVTKTLTLGSGVLVSAGTLTVGSYLSIGKFSTTHIKLDKICEPVLLAMMRRRFYMEKSSDDKAGEEDNIAAYTKEMVAAFKRRVRTQKKIPYTGRFECLGRRF